jgi:hypothetical protein
MLAKTGQNIGKFLTLVFTTLVAPIAVNVVVQDLNGVEHAPARTAGTIARKEEPTTSSDRGPAASTTLPAPGQSPPPLKPLTSTTIHPDALIRVTVQGTGHTPDEALRQALRIALYKAIVAEFGEDAWARSGQAIFENAWRNIGGIVQSWKTLAVTKEWKQGAALYQVDVTIAVDRGALLTRLGAAPAMVAWRPAELPPAGR